MGSNAVLLEMLLVILVSERLVTSFVFVFTVEEGLLQSIDELARDSLFM